VNPVEPEFGGKRHPGVLIGSHNLRKHEGKSPHAAGESMIAIIRSSATHFGNMMARA
jgi:hypothetical protein